MSKPSAGSNPRHTPPFVEFQTVKQTFRISLPHEQVDELMGLDSMQNFNNKNRQLGKELKKDEFKRGRHRRSETLDVLDFLEKVQKRKLGVKNKSESNQIILQGRLNSEFTVKNQKPSKKKSIKEQKKTKKNVKATKMQKQQTYSEFLQRQLKSRQIFHEAPKIDMKNLNDGMHGHSLNLRQTYKIHTSRQKYTQSINLTSREKKPSWHRRGHSEELASLVAAKTYNKQRNQQAHIKVNETRMLRKEVLSSSLTSIDFQHQQHEQQPQKPPQLNDKSKKLVSSLYQDNQYDEIDSEDEKLMSMVSLDTLSLKKARLGSLLQEEKTRVSQREDSVIAHQLTEQFDQAEGKEVNKELLTKIDSILSQINSKELPIKTKDKQARQAPSQQPEPQLGEQKWHQHPSILQLQIILDNCLSHTVAAYSPQLGEGRVVEDQAQLKLSTRTSRSEVEDKWVENEIRHIERAKKLLLTGLFQAEKVLHSTEQNTKDLLASSRASVTKSKPKSKSMLSLALKTWKNSKQVKAPAKQENILDHLSAEDESLSYYENSIHEESSPESKANPMEEQVNIPNYQTDYDISFKQELLKYDQQKQKLSKPPQLSLNPFQDTSQSQLEQVVEFIFIDLCLDCIEEIESDFINSFQVFEKLACSLPKKTANKLGFNSGPKDVYAVLQRLGKFLETTVSTQQQVPYKEIIFQRLQESIGPKKQEILRYMRDDYEQEEMYNSQMTENQFYFALNITWFEQFSRLEVSKHDFGVYYPMDKEKESKRVNFLRSALHIHNKAIFDSINEIIDKHRPYGIIGEPFPWKPHIEPRPINKAHFYKVLNMTFEEVIDNCRCLCGLFPEQHLSYRLTPAEHKELLEDRLAKMICRDVLESTPRWEFIDDEETQVLLELAKFVQRTIFDQVASEMSGLIPS